VCMGTTRTCMRPRTLPHTNADPEVKCASLRPCGGGVTHMRSSPAGAKQDREVREKQDREKQDRETWLKSMAGDLNDPAGGPGARFSFAALSFTTRTYSLSSRSASGSGAEGTGGEVEGEGTGEGVSVIEGDEGETVVVLVAVMAGKGEEGDDFALLRRSNKRAPAPYIDAHTRTLIDAHTRTHPLTHNCTSSRVVRVSGHRVVGRVAVRPPTPPVHDTAPPLHHTHTHITHTPARPALL
jgi:hypothetical protein